MTQIDYDPHVAVLAGALARWGRDAQIDMCIEEMAELTQALIHAKRGRDTNICEEIADVKIMLKQMELLFDGLNEVDEFMGKKMERLATRVADAERGIVG